jgi:hypothetical protein
MNININTQKIEFTKSYRDNKTNILLLELPSLEFENLSKFININSTKLYLKSEFHLTIIGNDYGKKILENLNAKRLSKEQINIFYNNLLADIENILRNNSIKLRNQYCVLSKDYPNEKRTSIIQIIETQIIDKVFDLLHHKYNIRLANNTPTPHVTLYIQKTNKGIGLYKKEDLKKYTIKTLNSLKDLKF